MRRRQFLSDEHEAVRRPFRFPRCIVCGEEVTEAPLRCADCKSPVHQREMGRASPCLVEHVRDCPESPLRAYDQDDDDEEVEKVEAQARDER